MQREVSGSLFVDLSQKPNRLLMPMLLHTVGDDLSFGQFDRFKKRCLIVAFLIVCLCFQSPGKYRQALLRTVQYLNLTLLVARKNQRKLRWVQMQPHNIHQFLNRIRIVGDFAFELFFDSRIQHQLNQLSINWRIGWPSARKMGRPIGVMISSPGSSPS